jgi:hypothetical protein
VLEKRKITIAFKEENIKITIGKQNLNQIISYILMLDIDVTKFVAPPMGEIPAKCKLNIAQSAESDGLYNTLLKKVRGGAIQTRNLSLLERASYNLSHTPVLLARSPREIGSDF